jgi:hypothetical protein
MGEYYLFKYIVKKIEFVGRKEKFVLIEPATSKYCKICKETKPFSTSASYVVHHLVYVVRWSSQFQFRQICTRCKYSYPADRDWLNAKLSDEIRRGKFISFIDRFGWLLTLICISTISAYAYTQNLEKDRTEALWVATPKVDDRYIVKADKFVPSYFKSKPGYWDSYGLFEIVEVKKDRVFFELHGGYHQYLNEAKYAHSYQNTRVSKYNFNEKPQIVISNIALQKMQKDGVIKKVYRVGE